MADPYAIESEAEPVLDAESTAEDTAPTQTAAEKLMAILQSQNLAAELGDEKLSEISHKVIEGYELDDASRETWMQQNKAAMDLAMLVTTEKDYPFKGAANVKYPLLTTAALQFNARAYPAIVQGDRVAKCKVNGHDQDGEKVRRGERVSEHLSWQLTTEMPEWEEDTDRLLLIVSIPGCVFRKTYYDPSLGRKASRLVTADRLVMNYKTRSIADCPRVSEEMWLYPYEIEERIRDGRFVEFEYGDAKAEEGGQADADGPHKFVEQHRLLDLDDDGYAEPYICTVHLETQKVCRVVPNFTMKTVRVTPDGRVAAIRKQEFYTKYVFMQSPDGGAYGMGLGQLLLSTNEAINTTLNEMLDAGHLSNVQGGFVSAMAGLRDKHIKLSKGEFKVLQTNVPINQAVLPVKFDGPSDVLFKLLGLLIEQGKEVSAVKDVLMGDTGGKVLQPTTTLALIEQGMKVFNAIFKRIHRAVKHELELHARLNEEHLTSEDYNSFFDGPEQYDPKADYNLDDMNIGPVSDAQLSTQMQKLAQAQVTREIGQGKPWINQTELDRRAFEAAGTPDIDKLFVPPPEPDPMVQRAAEANVAKLEAEVVAVHAETEAKLAEAHRLETTPPPSTPDTSQADANKLAIDAHNKEQDRLLQIEINDKKLAFERDRLAHEAEMTRMENELKTRVAAWSNLTSLETARISASGDTAPEPGPVETELEGIVGIENKAPSKTIDALNQLGDAVKAMHQTLTAPTEIIRDAQGRAVGARKVVN